MLEHIVERLASRSRSHMLRGALEQWIAEDESDDSAEGRRCVTQAAPATPLPEASKSPTASGQTTSSASASSTPAPRSMWDLLQMDDTVQSNDSALPWSDDGVEPPAPLPQGPVRVLTPASPTGSPQQPHPALPLLEVPPSPMSAPPTPVAPPLPSPLPARGAAAAPKRRPGLSARLALGQRTPGGPWALRLLELGDAAGPALRLSNAELVGVAALATAEASALRRLGARWPVVAGALVPLLARLEAPRLAAWAALAAAEVAAAAAAEEAGTAEAAFGDEDALPSSSPRDASPRRRRRRRRAAPSGGIAAQAELVDALAAVRAAAAALATEAGQHGTAAPRAPLAGLPARGELLRRSTRWPFAWEPRFVVVTWRSVAYFKSRGARAPSALLELPPGGGARALQPTEADGRAAAFCVRSTAGEELVLAASNDAARDRWLVAFAAAGGTVAAAAGVEPHDYAARRRLQDALARAEAAAAAVVPHV